MVLAATVNGMPLVYSGQEAGLNRSLKFFDKDVIEWHKHPFEALYAKLFALKHNNQALWNGSYGGEMIRIFNDKPEQVISFSRTKGHNRVVLVLNYSNQAAKVTLHPKHQKGDYVDYFSNTTSKLTAETTLDLAPWSYKIFVANFIK